MSIRTPQQSAHPSTDEPSVGEFASASGDLLDRLRERTPLVQSITNAVVTNFTANVLLAIGAAPAMTDIPTEAGPFARIASGVLLNLGTPQAEQREAMVEAASAANDAGTPWVLDPVAVGFLPVRTALAAELLALRPTIVRGNASEIIALAGLGAGGRGVDSTDAVDSAIEAATAIARTSGAVVAVSGPTDVITDGERIVRCSNGHAWLTLVTGGGCALGAVLAAFASLDDDRLLTTVAATTAYTVAAQLAAAESRGPGSFAPAFLDHLHLLDADTVRSLAVIA
ncbi:hydroxyethylthiazole kinase [Plantibacter sp. VKM Ac-1784]|uniref:Hydroxyethylthiazole kinase n=1 Tax=Plantibacter elymi (nom. nud.) TaxID=199708 RepID=A0ABY1RFZ9_9MICO|nr:MULTISPECIES: hydroxyethylthiazole kinase [Plantibacter]CAH0228560.1 Hydroxyethylthiazole kinase [Plantibacter cousiniae]SMQ73222.1 hydroxyethylthiazole kinase [Plantibacter sp. VKM Ac-1784]